MPPDAAGGGHSRGVSDRHLMRANRPSSRSRCLTLDGAVVATVTALAAVTAVPVLIPALQVRFVARSLDLVLDTVTTVVTIGVAALGWIRFRQRGEPVAPLVAAAFLVLAIVNGLAVALAVTGLDRQAGMTLTAPSQAPLYESTIARVFAAALLVLGGVGSLRAWRIDHAAAVVLGSAAAIVVMTLLIHAGADRLPSLGSIGAPGQPIDAVTLLPTLTPLGAAFQVLGASLFLLAAGLARRLHRRDRAIGDAYLAVGLIFAAFAQVSTAVYPGSYTGLVTAGDLLRLGFDLILLLGIQAEARAALSRLQQANDDLARLRAVELERAALEERARLARELHDGLAQDLWTAKLKGRRLAAMADIGEEGRGLVDEVNAAVDAGLAEAHQAVAALRLTGEPAGTLCEVMARWIEEFSDRFGLRTVLECQPALPDLPPRTQAEALRITQEALNNVRRHADASVVRVKIAVKDGQVVVVVRDNGRGFDPDAVAPSAFGLASMRERAALIGGQLRIESEPHDGTRISLLLPVAPAGQPMAVGRR